ncbi:MAG: STAS domain-containing protein [Phycisphaerae bacterium]
MSTRFEDTLDLRVEDRRDATVVFVRGDVSILTADSFASQLEQLPVGSRPLVVLDLSEMNFICSRGLGAMVTLEQAKRRSGGMVRVAGPTRQIRQLLIATKLNKVLPIYEAVDRALM